MAQPFKQWTVLPHGEVAQIDDNILTVVGEIRMPLMDLPRRMTVVRLADSRLVVWSAIALDARIWKDRYPSLLVVAPEGARTKVEKIVPVDTVAPRFDDANIEFLAVPGTRGCEAALVVRTPNGTTLVLNDIVGNIRNESGLGGWLLGLAGFAGKQAQIPRVVKMAMIDDANALRAQLLRWAEIEPLRRILVSHGSPIEGDPRQTLRDLARSLE